MGTLGYMAPEQLTGAAVDHRSDIFAVGVMLVEALTGSRPFRGDGPAELIRAMLYDSFHLHGDSPGMQQLNGIVQRCLAKNPADRWSSAENLRCALIPTLRSGIVPSARQFQPGRSSSDATTHGVRVQVTSSYDMVGSVPRGSQYLFRYQVRISNGRADTVRVLSRSWVIFTPNGRTERVSGPGVVGVTPTLGPGELFEYESVCPLTTPVGSMQGTLHLVTAGGEHLDVVVAPFTLAAPAAHPG